MLRTPFILSACLVIVAGGAYAQSQQKMTIDEATVFLHGAELASSAHISLVRGENEILLTNVAGDVNSQSLVVNASNGVVVESAVFQNNYLVSDNVSPGAKIVKDSIETVTTQRQQTDNKIAVLKEQIAVLQANQKVGGNNTGLSVVELQKMLDLINAKMEGYLNQKNEKENLLKKIDEHLARLNQQLDEEQKKGYQPGGQLLVKFYTKESTASDIRVTYVVPNAGWSPVYDIWADDVNSPIKLYYKANVYQNSGVKWNNVKLSLSTGNPSEGAQAPTLNSWYLSFYAPTYNAFRALNSTMSQNAATGSTTEELKMDKTADLEKNEQSSINQYVQVDNSGINTSFDIDLPYTIPSDGQTHVAAVKKYDVPATYRYYAVPKLDKDAFLQAQITNWEDLNLLPAPTNIFYEGTYVGQGYIDVRNLKDTLTLSLGRDKKIVVKKERDTQLRSVKTIGTNVRETYAYNITVRNTRKENISIIIEDQMPVSNDKDIVIEDKETNGADYDETTGKMLWTLNLKSNETKKLVMGYTVKYPKGKVLAQ